MEKEDWEDIYAIGHQLKGSGGSYGFEEISIIGGKIQEAALRYNQVNLRQYLSSLYKILDRLNDLGLDESTN